MVNRSTAGVSIDLRDLGTESMLSYPGSQTIGISMKQSLPRALANFPEYRASRTENTWRRRKRVIKRLSGCFSTRSWIKIYRITNVSQHNTGLPTFLKNRITNTEYLSLQVLSHPTNPMS